MKIFREALEAAYQEVQSAGKESFGEPEFYADFMQRFEELLDMVPTQGLEFDRGKVTDDE